MQKFAKILIVLSIVTLAGSGFLYTQHVGDAEGAVTGAKTPVYAGIAGASFLLLGLVLLNLDSKPKGPADDEASEGSYEPYGDEEYEDEYEDEEVY